MDAVTCGREGSLSTAPCKRGRSGSQAEDKDGRHRKRREGGADGCLPNDIVLIDLTGEAEETSEAVSQVLPRNTSYDTCFGVINLSASVSNDLKAGSMTQPSEVRPSGTTLRLFGSSSKQVGAIVCPTLCELSEKFRVTLRAFISVSKALQQKPNSQRKLEYSQCTTRVVVYGMDSEKRDVAYFLSGGDLFLQHPSSAEYDATVPYYNPQYLPGPDGLMPAIEDVKDSGTATGQILTEIEKARLLQLFETSSPSPSNLNVSPSPRLRSILKGHQLSALEMMVEKERGTLSGARYPTLWTIHQGESRVKRYHHIITGLPSERADPVPVKGGLLADEMGLGKTLSVLALIAGHLDNVRTSAPNNEIRSTLIVTPKSTIPEWEQQITNHMTPGSMTFLTYVGTNRAQLSRKWDNKDVVLTTYDTLRSERNLNGPIFHKTWARVILDEGELVQLRKYYIEYTTRIPTSRVSFLSRNPELAPL